ncbi:WAT1-related protein At4g01440-like isoform X2 [Panicum virgatum]|uniref:WAT1-related protein At4g01440-like isoform X2 n=1 Tax=Panicum virgatum TaxID=38727 RepID=UPI0019D5EE0B|nr:WAT1-related protein At4g01440-like isoform X2 [Panicum virgatum]
MLSAGCMEQWMPTAAMVTTSVVIAIMTALIKQALNQGMNRLVLITFRQMLATVFLGPIAYFKERKMRPKFTTEIFMYTFLSGILGPVLLQYTLFVGLDYTTATFAATFSNMLPVVTFLISLAFRFESLEVRSKSGSAKISGTLISLGGAMMLTFYKGSALTHNTTSSMAPAASSSGGHRDAARWVLGSVSMLANVVGFALWLLLQRKFTKKYPAVYSATAFMSLFSFVQSGALTLSIQRSSIAVWALKGTIEIVTVVYCVRRRSLFLLQTHYHWVSWHLALGTSCSRIAWRRGALFSLLRSAPSLRSSSPASICPSSMNRSTLEAC